MDDEMENEIISELFSTHANIIWRYLGVTTTGLIEMIRQPGESFKSKILQPGPFMFLMFMLLVMSIILQSSSAIIRHLLVKAHYAMGFGGGAGFNPLGDLNLVSTLGSDVLWDFNEGIAGICGMQGRRGNMEDRYRIMQDIDVGDKKMSFFGVFDGHGGQYTAEFVKDHLFDNVIEKIKQLRSQESSDKEKSKAKINNNENNNLTVKTPEKRKSVSKERSPNINKVTESRNGFVDSKLNNECQKDEKKVLKKEEEDLCTLSSQKGSSIENIEPVGENESVKKDDSFESMKKDDMYSNVNNLKKRNSIANNNNNSNGSNGNKENKEEPADGNSIYIDNYKNVNYTRLLTDMIIAVDKEVVEKCKSRTDMSGSTAVIAVLDGELLIIGNVGDSRAVMGDLKGSTIPLSFDHKPNQLKERRRIKEAGGFITFTGVWRVAGILATSRALGDFPLKEPRKLITAEPDVLTFSLRDHKAQFVILATDGLWDVLTNEEAVAFVRNHFHEPDYGAKSLTLHAYYRGSQDNITVAILNIDKLGL